METTCGFLLEQLKERKDVQLYFKKILLDIIEKTEEKFSSKEINFDIQKIEEEIIKLRKEKNDPKSIKEKKDLNLFYMQKNKDNTFYFNEEKKENGNKLDKNEDKITIFNKKYLPNMTLDELQKIKKLNEESKDKDMKIDMKEYIELHLISCQNNEEIYQNSTFFNVISKSKLAQDILSMYQNMFIGIIEIINQLLQNLLDNIDIVPYSIKAISQVLILLIRKKFPKIKIIEQNMFLSQFFLNLLLSNFLSNPSLLLLINNIISENTLINLKLISSFLKKLISCKFYQNYINECSFIPFNWFFFDEIPKVIKFYKNFSKNVKLPLIVQKLVNGELEKNLTFEYFKEKNDIIGHKSICYSYNDLFILLDNINRCKNILFLDDKSSLLKKTYDKINKEDAEKILDKIKNNPQYETIIINNQKNIKTEIKRPIIKYFLLSDLLVNEQKTDLFFENNGNESFANNTNCSIKNNICDIFNNNKIIEESDFNINNENTQEINKINMMDILNKYKNINNISYYSLDGTISENNKINWLIDDLSSLSEKLKENDYENLLMEIYKEKQLAINNINYKDLTYCIDKLQAAKRYNDLYEQEKKIILSIDINNKVKKIVNKENITVELYFKYDEKEKELKIDMSKKNKKNLHFTNEKKDKNKKIFSFEIKEICPTINSFIKAFPDIAIISELNKDNIFDIYKEIEINKRLQEYFKLIENHLSKFAIKDNINNLSVLSDDNCLIFDNEEFEKIFSKIKDYIFEKLYVKIFPKTSNALDNKIYLNSLKLSWTEPKHYLKEESIAKGNVNFDFKRFISEMKLLMKNIEKEKIPWKKVELIYNILKIMDNCFTNKVKMSNGQDFFKNILIYTLVKIRPSWLYSNCLFIKAFIDNQTNITGESIFEILSEDCKFFEEISYKKLLGITEEEFNKKCEKSLHEI